MLLPLQRQHIETKHCKILTDVNGVSFYIIQIVYYTITIDAHSHNL